MEHKGRISELVERGAEGGDELGLSAREIEDGVSAAARVAKVLTSSGGDTNLSSSLPVSLESVPFALFGRAPRPTVTAKHVMSSRSPRFLIDAFTIRDEIL